MTLNDAEFINDGEEFIKYIIIEVVNGRLALSTFHQVFSLKTIVTSEETNEKDIRFENRKWQLGSIIDDAKLTTWIKEIKKQHVKATYSKIEESSVKCVHLRVKKSWCLF